jgi:hypothetical protein
MLSVPARNLRLENTNPDSAGRDEPPIAQQLDISVQDLARALVQCQAFKFEERILQFLGLEEKFDINFLAGDFDVGSKVCKGVVFTSTILIDID